MPYSAREYTVLFSKPVKSEFVSSRGQKSYRLGDSFQSFAGRSARRKSAKDTPNWRGASFNGPLPGRSFFKDRDIATGVRHYPTETYHSNLPDTHPSRQPPSSYPTDRPSRSTTRTFELAALSNTALDASNSHRLSFIKDASGINHLFGGWDDDLLDSITAPYTETVILVDKHFDYRSKEQWVKLVGDSLLSTVKDWPSSKKEWARDGLRDYWACSWGER